MNFGRKYLLSKERKKLRMWITVFAFVIAMLVFGIFKTKFPEYRITDLAFVPLYVFVAAWELSNARAMEQVWGEISPRIVVIFLFVATLVGALTPASILTILTMGLILGGIGLILSIITRSSSGRDVDFLVGFGTIMRTGFGFGFGLKLGFVFGFVAWGLLYLIFYYEAMIFGPILKLQLWSRIRFLL